MKRENKIVRIDDFFDFKSKKPINRLAYTKEDIDYKIDIIRKMQELGMDISVDKAGNICGKISIGDNPQKTIAIGSHTDSVYDGGQYDGTAGVIVGLDVAEKMTKTKNMNGILYVSIYACEESSRFGTACIGSKYLNGDITEEDFEKIFDQKELKKGNKVRLKEEIEKAIIYLRENVEGIQVVDKIFDRVDYALESHIEQYEMLYELYKKNRGDVIGIVNAIGSATRIKYRALGKADHTGACPMGKRSNADDAASFMGIKIRKLGIKYEKKGLGRANQVEINTIGHKGSFNQVPDKSEGLIDIRMLPGNTTEKALRDYVKIKREVEKETKTKIKSKIVSKGKAIATSGELNKRIADICSQDEIKYLTIPSYPGQDLGYVPADKKTMTFMVSKGGSHNPKESTQKRHIELSSKVFTELTKELMQSRFKDRYKVNLTSRLGLYTDKVKETMKKGLER